MAAKVLIDADQFRRTVARIAHEIVEHHPDTSAIALVGLHTRGVPLAERLRVLIREFSGGEPATTNNRMELTAALRGLEALKRPTHVRLHTDSRYVLDGIEKWIVGWKRNGWKTASKAPVKNEDLWRALDAATAGHRIEWIWVKGHAGDPGNERADALANAGIDALVSPN